MTQAFQVAAATTRLRKVHIGTGPASPIGAGADGTLRWMLTRKRAYEPSGGKRILVGLTADISEIKAGEAAFRASEARAHRLALLANRTGNALEWPLEVAPAQDLYDAAAVLLREEIEDVVA